MLLTVLCWTQVRELTAANQLFGQIDTNFNCPDFFKVAYPARVVSDKRGGLLWTRQADVANGVKLGQIIRTSETGVLDTNFVVGPLLTDAWTAQIETGGKILVSGNMAGDTTNGLPCYRIFRFNTNGTLDGTYSSPIFDSEARTLALQPDGKLIVPPWVAAPLTGNGGIINTVRLNADGSLDTNFVSPVFLDPLGASNSIYATPVIDSNGGIYLAGTFVSANGVSRPGIARLLSNGSLDTNFVPSGLVVSNNPFSNNPYIRAIALQSSGVLLGGQFSMGVFPRPQYPLIRLNFDGSFDSSFGLVSIPNFIPRCLKIEPVSGLIYALHNRLRVFLPWGESFGMSQLTVGGSTMELLESGKIIIPTLGAGNGTSFPSAVAFNGLVQDTSFAPPSFQNTIFPKQLLIQSDDKLLAHGDFDHVGTNAIRLLARFSINGVVDSSYGPLVDRPTSSVDAAALGTNDELFAVLTSTDGDAPRQQIFRITKDGVFDTNFFDQGFLIDPGFQSSYQWGEVDLTAQDGRPVLSFNHPERVVDGKMQIARLNMDGGADTNFVGSLSPAGTVFWNMDSNIQSVVVGTFKILGALKSGKMIASVTTNQSIHLPLATMEDRIFRLNSDGTIDPSFNPPLVGSSPVTTGTRTVSDPMLYGGVDIPFFKPVQPSFRGAVELSDGSVVVGGSFVFAANGTNRYINVAKLRPDGSVDTTFGAALTLTQGMGIEILSGTNFASEVDGVGVDAANRIWICGNFDSVNGVRARGIARLDSNGKIDSTVALQSAAYEFSSDSSGFGFTSDGAAMFLGKVRKNSEFWPHGLIRLVDHPPLTISRNGFSEETGFFFDFPSIEGGSYRVQATTNFSQWIDITNFLGSGASATFRDANKNSSRKFYRIVSP